LTKPANVPRTFQERRGDAALAEDATQADEAEATATKAFAAKANNLRDLREAVVDAAGVGGGLWLSYLFVFFYLAIASGGVTDSDLFFENRVKLPFLNKQCVPTALSERGFFGPLLRNTIRRSSRNASGCATPPSEGKSSTGSGGNIPGAASHSGLDRHAKPGPIYARRGSMRCPSPGSPLDLVSSRTTGRPLARRLSRPFFAGVFGEVSGTARAHANPRADLSNPSK
jgi:hypothetical protein